MPGQIRSDRTASDTKNMEANHNALNPRAYFQLDRTNGSVTIAAKLLPINALCVLPIRRSDKCKRTALAGSDHQAAICWAIFLRG